MTDTQLITDQEMRQLIQALARSGQPFSEEDVQTVLTWVAEVRISTAVIQLALTGRKALCVEDGQVKVGDNVKGVRDL